MENTPAQRPLTPAQIFRNNLNNPKVKERFDEILKQKSPSFIASLLALANSNEKLAKCDNTSVINAALIAATLDLPINPNLGFAYIIPYGTTAQFQIGYKGFLQLALRSGKLKTINVTEVYEGQLVESDPFKGKYLFREDRTGDKVIGYYAYIETVNGFEKGEYWSIEKTQAHGKKFSKQFGGLWTTDPHAMGKKTVLKMLISKWTELSIDTKMQTAIISDQAVINNADNLDVSYVDAEDVTNQKQIDSAVKPNDSKLFDETPNK